MKIDGVIYLPSNHLNLGGTGGQVGNQLITNTIHVFGNGQLVVAYSNKNATVKARACLVR